ncbi:general stress protein [Dermatophilus congolensis]|uniref:general stress protein n=1 Tax=Dermatophilus congolensis TaxID=1863 RepID=UPI001AAFECEE|nr:general stress protein [Dermatophilus congolensis]
MSQQPSAGQEILNLEFPQSLALFDRYADAQKAVDFLSDEQFPVQNVMIVGTDLRQVERVTGRLTWPKVLGGGVLSGMWMGLFVGLILSMFEGGATLGLIGMAVGAGAVFGFIWAGLGYSMSRGRRDFTSVSQVVATKYELLVEHRAFGEAQALLSKMDGVRGALVTSGEPKRVQARPNPFEGMYGQKIDASGKPVASSDSAQPAAGSSADSPGADDASAK